MTITDTPAVLLESLEGAPAKTATRRDPRARTDGAAIANIAAALGKPLMPWQRYVADVATEREADGSYRYEIVLVTVPRQSGKTTLLGSMQLHRIATNRGIKIWYTAQTGKDATARFTDLTNLITESPLAAIAKVRYSAGTERVTLPNGSTLNIFAPVKSALHGETPPLVTFDEIWAYDEALGDAMLEGTVIPGQMTLTGRRQVWLVSTAGDATSRFMRKWVERGRRGSRPKMAYFEWALPDGGDPYDADTIASFHPAVGQMVNGHRLTAEDILANAAVDPDTGERMSHASWLRGFCNVWTEAADPIMPAEDWEALATLTDEKIPATDVVVTYDVAPENAAGSVVASWRDETGKPCIRVIHTAPGTSWMHDYLVRVHRHWKPAGFGADNGGATRRLTDQLRRTLGEDAVRTTNGTEYGIACAGLIAAARDDGTLRHGSGPSFANAIAHLVINKLNGGERIDRDRSTGPVAALVAAAVGVYFYDHPTDDDLGKPEIYT